MPRPMFPDERIATVWTECFRLRFFPQMRIAAAEHSLHAVANTDSLVEDIGIVADALADHLDVTLRAVNNMASFSFAILDSLYLPYSPAFTTTRSLPFLAPDFRIEPAAIKQQVEVCVPRLGFMIIGQAADGDATLDVILPIPPPPKPAETISKIIPHLMQLPLRIILHCQVDGKRPLESSKRTLHSRSCFLRPNAMASWTPASFAGMRKNHMSRTCNTGDDLAPVVDVDRDVSATVEVFLDLNSGRKFPC